VWGLPAAGLVFTPLATLRAHDGGVTALAVSWNHLYTAGSDSRVKVWHLCESALQYIRSLPCEGQTIKSLYLDAAAETGAFLYAGLTSGKIIRFRIGTYG
jgi:WD40 repeat protein